MGVQRKATPVGLGYLPKGGRKAAQVKNAQWVVENEAAMAARSAASQPAVAMAAPADAAQVRVSAPESAGDDAPYGTVFAAVERAIWCGAGGIAGSLFVLAVVGPLQGS